MAYQELSASAIRKGLATGFIGQKIIYFPRLPSTMEAARREARQGASEGTVVLAGEQTAGRGRLKRAWIAPAGNIALSIILYPGAARLSNLIMIASLAAARGIEDVTGLKTQIKWPNDVLTGGKKVAGILIENEVKRGKEACAVVGIGINTALQPGEFREIAATANSLEKELGAPVSREEIIINLLNELERLYLLTDSQSVFKMWRDRLITLGQKVTATWGEETLRGVAESVDESGALLIRLNDGTLTRVVAGDVTVREK
jgi:BirA family transcriptional regulator, biotin operon repressor / biotin---[acetyl-CoA-carboxylase] ligase